MTKGDPPRGPDDIFRGGTGMIEALQERVNDDAGLVRRGRHLTTSFLLEVGQTAFLISIYEGRIVSVTRGPFVMPSSSFPLPAPHEEWQNFSTHLPPPAPTHPIPRSNRPAP